MPLDDEDLLARFNSRLSAIESEIPSPRGMSLRGAGAPTRTGGQRGSRLGWVPAVFVAVTVLAIAAIGLQTLPGPLPSTPAVGHTSDPSPTVQPTDGGESLVPTTPPSAGPTAPLTTAPPPTSVVTPSSTPPPTEPPSADVWRGVTEWPTAPAHVTAVVAGGPGFMAVGFESKGAYLCEQPDVDGIVWTSSNGEEWIESRPEALAGLSLRRLVNAGGTIYAFGSVGHVDCAAEYVMAIARSLDGSNWDRLQLDQDGLFFNAIGAIGGTLIAVSDLSAWTSADGMHWERAGDVPLSFSVFEEVAAVGATSVIFESLAEHPISLSDDAGESWRAAAVDSPYQLDVHDVIADGDRIVVVGSACCALSNEPAGVSMASTDGDNWEESGALRDVAQAVVSLSDGYLAIGRSTWISADGLDWRVGPQISELDTTEQVTAVSTDLGVLVINSSFCCTAGADFSDAAWFAPTDAFALDRWTAIPPAVEMPELGVRYPAEIFMHCGFSHVSFGLRAWTPDPPFEDNHNPPPGYSDEDRGWLTQLSADELLYESRGGNTVNLVPSESAGPGPCA